MRDSIHALGGEIRFQMQGRPTSNIENGQVRGVTLANGETIAATTSCSRSATARATRSRCSHDRGVHIEPKPFSIGFRIEHPQSLIDRARYGKFAGSALLGAADYKLVHHCGNGRSVYSFCMCPGGTVVAAASEPGRVVTNGMSQYSRNERNANAGIVVGITPADFPGHALAGIEFQRHWESARIRSWRPQLLCARPTGRRLHCAARLDDAGHGDTFVCAGRAHDRLEWLYSRLRGRRHS